MISYLDKARDFFILLSIFVLTPAPIRAHSRTLPHAPAHSRTLPHTPAPADAQILMGEWQKLKQLLDRQCLCTVVVHANMHIPNDTFGIRSAFYCWNHDHLIESRRPHPVCQFWYFKDLLSQVTTSIVFQSTKIHGNLASSFETKLSRQLDWVITICLIRWQWCMTRYLQLCHQLQIAKSFRFE